MRMDLFGGVIVALAGAGLMSKYPGLGGVLVGLGYGYSAYRTRLAETRAGKSFYFGFIAAAVIGLLVLTGELVLRETTNDIIEALADQTLLFVSFCAMPWAIAIVKYFTSFSFPWSLFNSLKKREQN